MEVVRCLMVNAYRYPELKHKIKEDYTKLYDKWQYYREVGSNFCPRVCLTFETIYRQILSDDKLNEYKRYTKPEEESTSKER